MDGESQCDVHLWAWAAQPTALFSLTQPSTLGGTARREPVSFQSEYVYRCRGWEPAGSINLSWFNWLAWSQGDQPLSACLHSSCEQRPQNTELEATLM